MQVDFSRQPASRQSRRKRIADGTLAALLAGAVSLMFSFALGLQDASWTDAWTGVGQAYILFGSHESGRPRQG